MHVPWILFALVGILCLWRSNHWAGPEPGDATFLRFAAVPWLIITLLCAFGALYSKVTFDREFVEVRLPFRKCRLKRDSIESIRTGSAYLGRGAAGGVGMRVLILENKGLPNQEMRIPAWFAFDDAWDDWISTLKNLDENEDAPISIFGSKDPDA